MTVAFEVYFHRPDDCVVYAPTNAPQEISLVHRQSDGSWHCALCGGTHCRHTAAAEASLLTRHAPGSDGLGRSPRRPRRDPVPGP
jgi:alanyl-tRNA synthetase